MNRTLLALGVVVLAGVGVVGWLYFAGGSGEPTVTLTTPTIATTSTTEGSTEETSATTTAAGATAFFIDQEQSQASFTVTEELQGNPNEVVGFTNELVGQVLVDPDNPETVQISEIVINARTLMTDDENRNRAIRSPLVLDSASDQHELITFLPTAVESLEGPIEVAEAVQFTVTGDLTIKGVTNETTFEVTATLVDESTIQGVAEAVVQRSDFGIGIPNVPNVANVSQEVTLLLAFVATAG